MLTSVACSCLRNGRKLAVPAAKLCLFSGVKHSPSSLQQFSTRLLAPVPRQLCDGVPVRSVSLSAPAQRDTDPLDARNGENFGSISADMSSRRSFRKSCRDLQDPRHQEEDAWAGEEEAEEPVRTGRRNTPYWYHLQCKKLIRENKLQEALQLFSSDMLQKEQLQPLELNYTVLIGGCGRAGRLTQAFRLYNDMKKRGLDPVDATYTALFNACAESSSKEAGLRQALKLEQELRRKNIPLSTITYHALLKAHAITNHLQACVHTLREMLEKGHVVTQETFHYLLMGCLKDKETGFRLALQVWRQMLKSGIRPDGKNYNLLLRTARDCGIGDPVLANRILLSSEWERKHEMERESKVKSAPGFKDMINIDLLEKQLFLQPGRHGDSEESISKQELTQLVPVEYKERSLQPVDAVSVTSPNLLDMLEGKKVAVVSLGAVDGAADRLALIGGAKGFLEKMTANEHSPNLKTLSLLADIMEPGYEHLQMLLRVAKQHQVKLDIAFFNSAIRRAARVGNMEAAQGVLSVMRQRNVSVDVQTFGSLALGCERRQDGLQLLKDMEEAGLRPNVHVFSALIGRATRRLDYVYLKTILKLMTEMQVPPNEVIIRQLEFASQYPPNYNQYKSRNNYLVQIDGFRGFYKEWLMFMPAQGAEDEQEQLQTEPAAAALKTEAADGLTGAQRNQRAAVRRFYSRNKDKKSSAAL